MKQKRRVQGYYIAKAKEKWRRNKGLMLTLQTGLGSLQIEEVDIDMLQTARHWTRTGGLARKISIRKKRKLVEYRPKENHKYEEQDNVAEVALCTSICWMNRRVSQNFSIEGSTLYPSKKNQKHAKSARDACISGIQFIYSVYVFPSFLWVFFEPINACNG